MKTRARSATERATEINLMNFQLISRGSPATKWNEPHRAHLLLIRGLEDRQEGDTSKSEHEARLKQVSSL